MTDQQPLVTVDLFCLSCFLEPKVNSFHSADHWHCSAVGSLFIRIELRGVLLFGELVLDLAAEPLPPSPSGSYRLESLVLKAQDSKP